MWKINNYNCFPGHSRLGNTEPFKSKLSKASQEVLQRRYLLLENEKKKGNMAVTLESYDSNSGEKIKRSISIHFCMWMNFSGQHEEMDHAAATDEEERILIVTDTEPSVDTISGENLIQYSNVDDYKYFPGQSGPGNTEPFKSKLSKASQEAVLRRHLLLENEKKKNKTYI